MISQSGWVGNTVLGKTADLTEVDTLHRKGKPQKNIAKEADWL